MPVSKNHLCVSPPNIVHDHAETASTISLKRRPRWAEICNLPTVRKQLKNYERMKLLMDRWIELATELSNLRLVKEIAPKAGKT